MPAAPGGEGLEEQVVTAGAANGTVLMDDSYHSVRSSAEVRGRRQQGADDF